MPFVTINNILCTIYLAQTFNLLVKPTTVSNVFLKIFLGLILFFINIRIEFISMDDNVRSYEQCLMHHFH